MATIKSYTSLEQSKKLAEILPLESADMSYRPYREEGGILNYQSNLCPYRFASWIGFPCWSLAALLSVLPYPSSHKTFSGWRCDSYNKEGTSCILGEPSDNPVDACYEMILKLHELKML